MLIRTAAYFFRIILEKKSLAYSDWIAFLIQFTLSEFMLKKINILFLCTGNSCRSQMAEGLARALKGDTLNSYSAGVEPKVIDARGVKVMHEIGIDISGYQSKHLDALKHIDFDYVITLCGHANETCPLFPGKTKIIHHGFDDPPALALGLTDENMVMEIYRKVRDEIKSFILTLPESLYTGASGFIL